MSIPGPDGATAWRGRQTSQHASAFPESTVEGFFCVDPRGRCTFASESVGRMLGYEPGELLGADVRVATRGLPGKEPVGGISGTRRHRVRAEVSQSPAGAEDR